MPGGGRALEPVHARETGPDAELFVVEGESAALAIARLRDERRQGLVPMQGKPLSASRASRSRVVAQPFYTALAGALGAPIGESFDARGLRYGRLLILTDPDADGIHCGLLLLGFLLRWMRPLVDGGLVGWVRPPWGVVEGGVAGSRIAHSEEEFLAASAAARAAGPVRSRRFRGLAAIDGELLAATCLDPVTRRVEPISAAAIEGMLRTFAALSIADVGPLAREPDGEVRANRPSGGP